MSLAHRLSAANRHRKWDIFTNTFTPNKELRILDVGFSEEEFSPTDNYLEKYYPFPENVTALGIDQAVEFTRKYPKITTVTYAGGGFPFPDQSFDIVWSNAVVEHVGDFERQEEFLREIKRVGKHFFITTPNRFFPVEVHTRIPLLHFLPKPIFDSILRLMGKSFFAGDYMHLSSESRFKRSLRKAGFGGFKFYKNRLAGFVVDFVAVG
jgi:SAM-dependent methyltransferase